MAKETTTKEGVEHPPKRTLRQITRQNQLDYPYWLLIPKKGGPDPRIVDDGSFLFTRHPYDSHRNSWCFQNAADRESMKTQHGGQDYNHFIPEENKP